MILALVAPLAWHLFITRWGQPPDAFCTGCHVLTCAAIGGMAWSVGGRFKKR
ncbi:MAG: hypothetical protein WEA04_02730 [Candidatus Andersenbacteria bacterium]